MFHSLENYKSEDIRALKEKIGGSSTHPRLSVVWPLNAYRQKAFEKLRREDGFDSETLEMAKSNDVVEREIGLKLIRIAGIAKNDDGKQQWRVVAQLGSHEDQQSNNDVGVRIERRKHPWLLSSRKPIYAADQPEALQKNFEKLETIVKEMRDEFGERFVGVTFFGSTSKGYWNPNSDVDFMVIAESKTVFNIFEKKLKEYGLRPCPSCVYSLETSSGNNADTPKAEQKKVTAEDDNKQYFGFFRAGIHRHLGHNRQRRLTLEEFESKPSGEIEEDAIANLFHGIFFGNHDALLKLQIYIMDRMDQNSWDRIRKRIVSMQTNLFKAVERHGLSDSDIEKIEAAALILRTPPSYEEAKQTLTARLKRITRKKAQ